jgi:hypothetical protein
MKRMFTFLSIAIAIGIQAQNKRLGINTTTPQANLDVSSTESGVLIPRMTLSQMNAIPLMVSKDGMLIFVTDTTPQAFHYYDGTAWKPLVSSATSQAVSYNDDVFWKKNGNAGTNPANDFLGTTDATNFKLKTNATDAITFAPALTTIHQKLKLNNIASAAGLEYQSASAALASIIGVSSNDGVVRQASSGTVAPITYTNYNINNVDGDYMFYFNTGINPAKYVVILNSYGFSKPLLGNAQVAGATGDAYSVSNVYTEKRNNVAGISNWALSADYVGDGPGYTNPPTNTVQINGNWFLGVTIFSTSILKEVNAVTTTITSTSGAAAAAPSFN